MRVLSFLFDAGLFALNVALGSIVLGFAAFMVALFGRRDAQSLVHAFLCVALTMTLTSPLAIWIVGVSRNRYCLILAGLNGSKRAARPQTLGTEGQW